MGAGARLKDYLYDHDIKHKQIIDALSIPQSTFSNYMREHSDMPHSVLVQVATHLNITTDYLLGLTEDPTLPYPVSNSERALLDGYRSLTKDQQELIRSNIALMQRQSRRG